MSGSNPTSRERVLAATKTPPTGGDYAWDGVDEDDRPFSADELRAGAKPRRGRPPGSNKSSTTIRLDNDVLEAFRAGGEGWQTRINAALREWLEAHPQAVSSR